MRGLCADSARQFWTVRQSAAACPIFRHTQLRPVLCLPAVGGVGTNLDQILTIFFGGFLLLHASPWCPECAPCVGLHRGAAVRLIKNSKGSKKNSKTGQKRTQNGPKKNENLIFWKLIFWVLHVRNDKIRCLTERISLIRRRWCAMREQVLVFFGDPHRNWILSH